MYYRSARVHIKAVIVVLGICMLLGVGAVAAHFSRKHAIAAEARTQARIALEREDWPAACQHLRLYLSKFPDDAPALRDFARAHLSIRPRETANIGAALSAYRQLLRIAPDDADNYGRLVRLYVRNGAFHEAAYTAERWLSVAPDDPAARLWLGKALLYQREFDRARDMLTQLVQSAPEHIEAYALLAAIANKGGTASERADAIAWMDRAVEDNPQSAEACVQRARLLSGYSGGAPAPESVEAARRDLQRAEQLRPVSPRTWLALSEQWLAIDDAPLARAALDVSRAADPSAVSACFDDPDDFALGVFQLAARLHLHTPDPLVNGPRLADDALASLQQRPHRVLALPLAVKLHVNAGALATARSYLNEYTALLPPEPPAAVLDQLPLLHAAIAAAEHRPYTVIEQLEPLAARNAELSPAWKMLARAYGLTHQPRRAARALSQWLRLEPDNPDVTIELLSTCVQQRDWGRALESAALLRGPSGQDTDSRVLGARANLQLLSAAQTPISGAHVEDLSGELTDLCAAHPDRIELRLLLAALHEAAGDTHAAEAELQRAIDECRAPPAARLQLAQLLARNGEIDRAFEMCHQARVETPGQLAAWTTQCDIQLREGCVDDARVSLTLAEQEIPDGPERTELVLRRARLELAFGDRATGIALLRSAAENPSDARVFTLLLDLPEVRTDSASAESLVAALKQLEGPNGLQWRYQHARRLLESSEWQAGRQEIVGQLSRCIDADPGWIEPVLTLGALYERLCEWSAAEEVYRRGLPTDRPERPVMLRLLALLERQGRFTDARALLAALPAAAPGLAGHRLGVALSLGNTTDAARELEAQIASNPADAQARVMLANLIHRQGHDSSRAAALLDEAEKLDPNLPAVVAARVWMLHDEGRASEARARLDALVASAPTFESYSLRAGYLVSAGQAALAESDYRRLAEMGPNGVGVEVLGAFLADTGRMDEAIDAWELGLRSHAGNARLARLVVRARLSRGAAADSARAHALLAELGRQNPDDPERLWLSARSLLDTGDESARQTAEALLERAIQIQPAALDAHLALINMAAARQDFAAARERATRAEASNGGQPALLLARAKIELALNNAALARALVRTVLASDSDSPAARDLLVELALQTREPRALEEAAALVDRSRARQPADPQLALTRAILSQGQEQSAAAIDHLEVFCRDHGPAPVNVLVYLSELHREAGDLAAAERRIDEAAARAPAAPDVWRARLRWLAASGRFDEIAARASDCLRESSPDLARIEFAAGLLAESGSPRPVEQARELLARVVAAAPELPEPRLRLAWLAFQGGDLDEAKRIYGELLAHDADNVQALNNLAWLLAERRGDSSGALKLIERAVELAPRDPHVLDTYGTILASFPQRLSEARTILERCVELTPVDSVERAAALLKLGRACGAAGDHPAEQRHIEASREIHRRRGLPADEPRSELQAALTGLTPAP